MTDEGEACKSEISTVFGRCRCCLEYGYMKNMWEEHYTAGEREIYGEMIMETFSIAWDTSSEGKAHICDFCVTRVRDATNFKREMLASEHLLAEDSDDENMTKADDDPTWYEYKEEPSEEEEVEEIEEYSEAREEERLEDDVEEANPQTVEYEEVEYLDEDALVVEGTSKKAKLDPPPETKTTRWPRKKKPEEISRPYKNYSEEDMRKAIQSVREGEMSISDAAKHYRVPRKTITAKLHTLKNKPLGDGRVLEQAPLSYKYLRGDILKHKQNIFAILFWSNATPLKGLHKDEFACCFCKKSYKKAAMLKRHNIVEHSGRLVRLHTKHTLQWTVRLDTTDLMCTICKQKTALIEDLLQHLKTHDKLVHTDVKNQIIPYTFPKDAFNCIQCGQDFKYFKLLTDHLISEHYSIYKCQECGKGFINRKHLVRHRLTHEEGEYNCSYCDKTFSSRVYVVSHERLVHQLMSKVTKCRHCTERFSNVKSRNLHEVSVHGAKEDVYECTICNCRLSSEISLSNHIRTTHFKQKRIFCDVCNKGFYYKRALDDHFITHTKEKNYKCECGKKFCRKRSLAEHMRSHLDDKRFSCEHCGLKFLQKVSLKRHLKSKHADVYGI